MKIILFLLSTLMALPATSQNKKPLRIGVAGLTHTHVHWILSRAHDGDIEIVGIAEPNKALAERFLAQHKIPMSLVYESVEEMLAKANPDAVTAFNSIDEHLKTVALCAPRKIHVMVEKPLAVNLADAREMQRLAKEHGIHLLTNYETTWYGSNQDAIKKLKDFGRIRKVVVHDGHQGPKEIGVNDEFLEWLTDPIRNGGGAITDFGCYGANLMTWLMKGERPVSVFAVTRQFKPEVYPAVDDDATIVVNYKDSQAIIQASWNWPFSRKDMEVYAEKGYVIADKHSLRYKLQENEQEILMKASSLPVPYNDPFLYLTAVVRNEITIRPEDLSALENNLVVMEILEAAKQSASTGKVVMLK